jgi:alkylation response protein AidB-like acyl-CoA dehydrogenase
MDFWLTDDQQALGDMVRTFVADRFALDGLPDAEDNGTVMDRRRWKSLADLGVFSLTADGMGIREAVVVFEQFGRGLVPGPLVSTWLAAGLVDGAADGSTIVGMLEPQPGATLVEHADLIDTCLMITDDTVWQVPVSALALEQVERPLDAGAPVWRVTGPVTAEALGATALATGDAAVAVHLTGVVLTAALQLGVALAAGELATAYAKEREQFGRPIGGFQAVKHLCADMLVKAEVARAAVYAAACALDGASDDDPAIAASAAKVVAGEAALANGRYGIQVHGGMGFTWEVHAQRYWKRAVSLDVSFGSVSTHSELMADAL